VGKGEDAPSAAGLPSEALGSLHMGEMDISSSLTPCRIQRVQPGRQGEFPVTFPTKEEENLESLQAAITETLIVSKTVEREQGANI